LSKEALQLGVQALPSTSSGRSEIQAQCERKLDISEKALSLWRKGQCDAATAAMDGML
jgi:hypothetical protein